MSSALQFSLNYNSLPLSKRIGLSGTKGMTKNNTNRDQLSSEWSNGANLVDPENGHTPLINAAIDGKVQLIRALIERGADIEYGEPKFNRSALIFACKFGRTEACDELLKRGAIMDRTDKFEMTALMHASKGGYVGCVSLLLSRHALPNPQDDNGFTAAHFAAQYGHKQVIELLADSAAALEIRNTVEGKTPLMLAAQFGRKETVETLIDKGATVNRKSTFDKFTALMLASKEGHRSTVSLLLARDAVADIVDIYGWSALHFAASWGRKETAHILIVEGNANVNARERSREGVGGTTPLIVAVKGQQVPVMRLLLNYGADVNLPEMVRGKSPLACAAEIGSITAIQCLFDYQVDINYRNHMDGSTALMEAARAGQRSALIMLLNFRADLNILDDDGKYGKNALDYAVAAGHRDTLLSAMTYVTTTAKVNFLPWIEMECPNMIRNSLCGGPAIFLNSILYGHKGIYHGLLHLPADFDIYLIYCLVIVASACKRASLKHPRDAPELHRIISEIDTLLTKCVAVKAMFADDANFCDAFVLGSKSARFLGDYRDEYFANAFLTGPLALYVQNGLTAWLEAPALADRIDASFYECLRGDRGPGSVTKGRGKLGRFHTLGIESPEFHAHLLEGDATAQNTFAASSQYGKSRGNNGKNNGKGEEEEEDEEEEDYETVNGYGALLPAWFYWRYTPFAMFLAEGAARALLLLLVITTTTITLKRDSFYSDRRRDGGSDSSGLTPAENFIALMTVLFVAYELGLMEEKRWAVSPSIVFNYQELERTRWRNVLYHFVSTPWKFLDLVGYLLLFLWLVIKVQSSDDGESGSDGNTSAVTNTVRYGSEAIANKFLAVSAVPLALGLLRYPAAFSERFGVLVISVFLATRHLFAGFFVIFLATGLGFGSALYAIFRGGVQLQEFRSPGETLRTLLDMSLRAFDTSIFDDSENDAAGSSIAIIFLAWTGVVLFSAIIADMTANYGKTRERAKQEWILQKVFYNQQFGLSHEKSALCMLPPPLNMVSVACYVPHVYICWRSRLYARELYCLSFAGTVSDWVAAFIVVLPVAIYEYFYLLVTDEETTALFKLLGMFASPFGIVLAIISLVTKRLKEPSTHLIVKSRLSDGRLRVSCGRARDNVASHSLADFEDERIHKNLTFFVNAVDNGLPEEDDDVDDSEWDAPKRRALKAEAKKKKIQRQQQQQQQGKGANRAMSPSGKYRISTEEKDNFMDDDDKSIASSNASSKKSGRSGKSSKGEGSGSKKLKRVLSKQVLVKTGDGRPEKGKSSTNLKGQRRDTRTVVMQRSQNMSKKFGIIAYDYLMKRQGLGRKSHRNRRKNTVGSSTRVSLSGNPFMQLSNIGEGEIDIVKAAAEASNAVGVISTTTTTNPGGANPSHSGSPSGSRAAQLSMHGSPTVRTLQSIKLSPARSPAARAAANAALSATSPSIKRSLQQHHHLQQQQQLHSPQSNAVSNYSLVAVGSAPGRSPGLFQLKQQQQEQVLEQEHQTGRMGMNNAAGLTIHTGGSSSAVVPVSRQLFAEDTSTYNAPISQGHDGRPEVQVLPDGQIDPFQPGFQSQKDQANFSVHSNKAETLPVLGVEEATSAVSLFARTLHGAKDAAQQEMEDLQMINYPSIYFVANRFAPLFTVRERQAIFEAVLPEEFMSDFTAAVRDTEEVLRSTQDRLARLENILYKYYQE